MRARPPILTQLSLEGFVCRERDRTNEGSGPTHPRTSREARALRLYLVVAGAVSFDRKFFGTTSIRHQGKRA